MTCSIHFKYFLSYNHTLTFAPGNRKAMKISEFSTFFSSPFLENILKGNQQNPLKKSLEKINHNTTSKQRFQSSDSLARAIELN